MAEKTKQKPLSADVVSTGSHAQREYSLAQVKRSFNWSGQIENPDEVLKRMARGEGVAFYFRMLRQFACVSGPVHQRIDRAAAIERVIVPGDPNVDVSVQMANDFRRYWQSVPNKETILRKLLMGQFVGYYPVEKVWGRHEATGLLAPTGLFDVPPEHVRFSSKDGSPLIVTDRNFRGVPVEDRKLFFFTWGSLATPYGQAELQDVYLPTWYLQNFIDFGSEAVEQLGRPIPCVFIPRTYTKSERDDIEKDISDQFKFYLTFPTDEARSRVEFPGLGAASGGTAGRSEQEWARYIELWIQNRLFGTGQTGDRGGQGNGKLEEQRSQIKDDKTAPASDALDECLTTGVADDVGEVNWSNQPRELWPRFKSDTTEVSQAGLNGMQASTATTILLRFAASQLTEAASVELMTAIGIPRQRAALMIESTKNERSGLTIAPEMTAAAPRAAQTQTQTTEDAEEELEEHEASDEMFAIPTADGRVLHIRAGASVRTARGSVTPDKLQHGDEIIVVREKEIG